MRLAVVGSRGFDNHNILYATIDQLREVYDIDTIVSGGAKGADRLAECYAKDYNLKMNIILPVWRVNGKIDRGAGYKRNFEIWDNSDLGVAFWDGKSKGTAHSFKISEKQKKLLYVFNYDEMNFYLHSKLKSQLKVN